MAKNPANRRRDVARRQRGRRHLIEQRLKDVMVVAIEQRHLHGRTGEHSRRVESSKATADDDDVRAHRPGAIVPAWRRNQNPFLAAPRQSWKRRVRSTVPTHAAWPSRFSTAR